MLACNLQFLPIHHELFMVNLVKAVDGLDRHFTTYFNGCQLNTGTRYKFDLYLYESIWWEVFSELKPQNKSVHVKIA